MKFPPLISRRGLQELQLKILFRIEEYALKQQRGLWREPPNEVLEQLVAQHYLESVELTMDN